MSALASEIDQTLQQLDSTAAIRLEKLVREALEQVKLKDAEGGRKAEAAVVESYVLPEHSFGLREGIDPTKLGQLAEDL